jgi:hypothetical protein
MKVVKFFSIALVGSFLVASSMFAADVDKSKDVKAAENSIRQQVASVLSSVSTDDADFVYVHFTVSAEKGFQLTNVKGENETLVENVKIALTSNAISTSVLEGKYLVKVRFIKK